MRKMRTYSGNSGPSLNERIADAESTSEVHALLATGQSYLNVTRRTENRWKRTAKRRIKELAGGSK